MSAAAVKNPLGLRLLKRILLLGVVLLLTAGALRALWEYQATLDGTSKILDELEKTLARPLSSSVWSYDQEMVGELLEGVNTFQYISYAGVVERQRVMAERGVRRTRDVLTRDIPLQWRHDGGLQPLGSLVLQVDLAQVRRQALRSALLSVGVNSGLILLVCLALFLLTRTMISRHLAAAAQHFQALRLDALPDGLSPLRLDKKWAGDELDILGRAVNSMQEHLANTYAQALAAEQEARSQARFPMENPNPVLRVDKAGVLTIANPASQGFLAHLGCGLGQALPAEYGRHVRAALESGEVQRFEAAFDGRTYAFAARAVRPEGYVNIYGLDITERKQAEDAIRDSLREKEILLKEIHHRVKNNLQIISSLLFLQTEYVDSPADRELFAESQKRIQAMALVHEELYGAGDLSSVNMREYMPRLVEQVLAGAAVPVRTEMDVDEVRLPVTRSIPCALALNELVMNAVKHAFRAGAAAKDPGVLRLVLHGRDGQVRLEVADNGPGLPVDFDLESSHTLGMTLVAALTRQLGGSVTAQNLTPGASFRLTFPIEAP